MKRKPYTVQEKEELLKSEAIEKIEHLTITYSKQFKIYAVEAYNKGKTPRQIFNEAGIKEEIIGKKMPGWCLKRWKKTYSEQGINGLLNENRGIGSSGRPRTKNLTIEEKLSKLERENEILKEQVHFLKKLRGWE